MSLQKPTFICIGAMKSGTTSLHNYLKAHPQVGVSEPKETNFFLDRHDKSISWYNECFKGDYEVYGEVSPDYTKYPAFSGVPKKMSSLLSNAKLIYLVRDPIQRAISHYVHNWVQKRISIPIDQAFLPVDESWYLNISRYFYQISQYLRHYPLSNILIIQSERLKTDREKTMEDIFEFIGVEPKAISQKELLYREYHVSANKKRKNVIASFLTKSKFGVALKKIGKKVMPHTTVIRIADLLLRDVRKPRLSKDVRQKAEDYLRDDIDRLRKLTGKTFSSWSV